MKEVQEWRRRKEWMRRTDVLVLIFKSQKRLDWVESQARRENENCWAS